MTQKGRSAGLKYDGEKVIAWQLLSPDALEETARVLDFGARKYDERNWELGIHYGRVFRALLGHLWDWWRRRDNDDETGLHHLGHAMCCLMFLLHFEKNKERYEDFDNRP